MSQKRTFYGVQILRGVAAVLVVLFHVTQNLNEHGGYKLVEVLYFCNAGVDLFFLISGFVIFSTMSGQWQAPGAWARFLSRRLTRILPLYWLVTSIKVASLVAVPVVMEQPELGIWQTVASYLFIPAWNSTRSTIAIIPSGWTLCFEMFFYYVWAVCLALGLRPVAVVTPLFATLALVGVFRTDAWGAAATLLDPLLLEFVAGMWIGRLAMTKGVHFGTLTAAMVLAACCLALVASGLFAPQTAYRMRVLVWGVPAAAILVAFIALENKVPFQRMKFLLLLGDASYALYLSESSVRPIISELRYLPMGVLGEYAVAAIVVVIAICVGVFVYYYVERPLLRGVRAALEPLTTRLTATRV